MVFVTFDEVRKSLKGKVIKVVSSRIDRTDENRITEAFNQSSMINEIKMFCKNKYGEDIPFLEIDRIEDQFLTRLVDEVVKEVR